MWALQGVPMSDERPAVVKSCCFSGEQGSSAWSTILLHCAYHGGIAGLHSVAAKQLSCWVSLTCKAGIDCCPLNACRSTQPHPGKRSGRSMVRGRQSQHLPGLLGPFWEDILGGCPSQQAFLGTSFSCSLPSQLWLLLASFCMLLLIFQVLTADQCSGDVCSLCAPYEA